MSKTSKAIKRFEKVLRISTPLARSPKLSWVIKLWMTGLAKLTLRSKKARKQNSIEGITDEWLRMFPKGCCGIDKVVDATGYAMVMANCPLVGTGDVHACYRMMEYDRALLREIDAELTVVASSADPRVTDCCKVAIRKQGDKRQDLIPAHLIHQDLI
jgi:hypothetical protein